MIKFIGNRGSGKTYQLMRMAQERQLPIIVNNSLRKSSLSKYAKNLGFDVYILTMEEAQSFYEADGVRVDCLLEEDALASIICDHEFLNVIGFELLFNGYRRCRQSLGKHYVNNEDVTDD